MVYLNPTILIISLNVNDLNTPIKGQRLEHWIFFLKPTLNIKQKYMKSKVMGKDLPGKY